MKTKIILEIGYNHNGNMEIAKQMIDEAATLEVWAVKFQKWAVDELPKWIRNKERNPETSFGETYQEHREALEFSIDQLKELRYYAQDKGLEFICSGKDFASIKALVEDMQIEWLKLPSQRLNEDVIYEYLMDAQRERSFKVMVSTGMAKEEEILKSRWIGSLCECIMHCVSLYPVPLEKCNIGFMAKHSFFNGYSSHEIGGHAVKYAVMLGAEYIERHFTLDKNMKGTDHKMSSDPAEMQRIIEEIQEAEMIRGNGNRVVSKEEIEVKKTYQEF